jgi:hypothetical protein
MDRQRLLVCLGDIRPSADRRAPRWANNSRECRDALGNYMVCSEVEDDCNAVCVHPWTCPLRPCCTCCPVQGVVSEHEAATAMRCVLEALAALHAADVVYGDVKPANFVRTKVSREVWTATSNTTSRLCLWVCMQCRVAMFERGLPC